MGDITEILAPKELNKNSDGTYTVTKNGNYIFTVSDSVGNTKSLNIKISNIDKLNPNEITLKTENIKATTFTLKVNVEDTNATEENEKSGIEKYVYCIGDTKYESTKSEYEFTGLTQNTQYSVYVVSYDKAGNYRKSENITVMTLTGDIPTLTLNGLIEPEFGYSANGIDDRAFDGDINTYIPGGDVKTLYLYVDSSILGKTLNLYYLKGGSYHRVYGYDNGGNIVFMPNDSRESFQSITIPENIVKLGFYFNEGGGLCEIQIQN